MVRKNYVAAPLTIVGYVAGILISGQILEEKANYLHQLSFNSNGFQSLSWIDRNIFLPIVQLNSPYWLPVVFASAIVGGLISWGIGRIIEKYVCHKN